MKARMFHHSFDGDQKALANSRIGVRTTGFFPAAQALPEPLSQGGSVRVGAALQRPAFVSGHSGFEDPYDTAAPDNGRQ
jgi:hypothetical protein